MLSKTKLKGNEFVPRRKVVAIASVRIAIMGHGADRSSGANQIGVCECPFERNRLVDEQA